MAQQYKCSTHALILTGRLHLDVLLYRFKIDVGSNSFASLLIAS